jgi:hypothetical protein
MELALKNVGKKATYIVPAALIVGGIYFAYKNMESQANENKFKNKNLGEGMLLAGLVSFAFILSAKNE